MLDVIIITFNETMNLPSCLKSLSGWTNRVFVVDSGSTDGTIDLARDHKAEVYHRPWLGYAAQKNWALDNLPLETTWTLMLDADEQITPTLRQRIEEIINQPEETVKENGFFINRLSYFLNQPIRHCGYFPSWNLRLFKRGLARFENRRVHEHMIISDPVGYIEEPILHADQRDLEFFYAKHNRYSSLEAQEIYDDIVSGKTKVDANLTRQTRRRRWLKRHFFHRLPLPSAWRFFYMYLIQRGFLDGWAGLRFSQFIAQYDGMVALKLKALIKSGGEMDTAATPSVNLPAVTSAALTPDTQDPANRFGDKTHTREANTETPTIFPAISSPDASPGQMHPESSSWSLSSKFARTLWMLIGQPLFRLSFHNWYAYRRCILRCFGAKIGKGVTIRPSVKIEIPWMLDIRNDATIGDYAILYALGKITICERAIISQYAHLCAGTHDYSDHTFKLLRTPINIGRDAWVGADAFIGPGVSIGVLSVVGARSSVYKDVPDQKVAVGNPARPIKDRVLR